VSSGSCERSQERRSLGPARRERSAGLLAATRAMPSGDAARTLLAGNEPKARQYFEKLAAVGPASYHAVRRRFGAKPRSSIRKRSRAPAATPSHNRTQWAIACELRHSPERTTRSFDPDACRVCRGDDGVVAAPRSPDRLALPFVYSVYIGGLGYLSLSRALELDGVPRRARGRRKGGLFNLAVLAQRLLALFRPIRLALPRDHAGLPRVHRFSARGRFTPSPSAQFRPCAGSKSAGQRVWVVKTK